MYKEGNIVKKLLFVLVVLLAGFPCAVGYAQEPLKALQTPLDQVIHILKDPRYEAVEQKTAEREKIWAVMQKLFNFTEMSKRTLARNWKAFTPKQRQEFSQVFGEFLGNTYLDKIQKAYQDEDIIYFKEKMISENKAVVPTKVIRENVDVPIQYSMILKKGAWRVYDVKIEGVSLVKNYRTQFGKALMKESPNDLIERLKKKVEKQKAGQSVSDSAV
jgi:phospholipid transport system substrate-binding protein